MTKVEEKYKGRSGDDRTRDIIFLVSETNDDAVALSQTLLAAPPIHDGLIITDPVSVEQIGPTFFLTTVHYGETDEDEPEPQTSDVEFSFDLSLTNQRTLYSISTVATHKSPSVPSAPNHNKAINVTHDGTIEGVDVREPQGSFQYTFYPGTIDVTEAYQRLVETLVGKVNSVSFKSRPAGEVMLVGASGRVRTTKDWEISFKFDRRTNVTGILIGDIPSFSADGFDYVWVYRRLDDDTASKTLVKKPIAAYVERIYERSDLNQLGF